MRSQSHSPATHLRLPMHIPLPPHVQLPELEQPSARPLVVQSMQARPLSPQVVALRV